MGLTRDDFMVDVESITRCFFGGDADMNVLLTEAEATEFIREIKDAAAGAWPDPLTDETAGE